MRTFEAAAGRLDAIVAATLGVTRVAAQRAIESGRVLVDGERRAKSFRLNGGEAVAVDEGERAVAERGRPPDEVLRQRGGPEEGEGRGGVQLDRHELSLFLRLS